jgi:hypothetical protein
MISQGRASRWTGLRKHRTSGLPVRWYRKSRKEVSSQRDGLGEDVVVAVEEPATGEVDRVDERSSGFDVDEEVDVAGCLGGDEAPVDPRRSGSSVPITISGGIGFTWRTRFWSRSCGTRVAGL